MHLGGKKKAFAYKIRWSKLTTIAWEQDLGVTVVLQKNQFNAP